jgi:hypothetical protein
MSRKQIAALVGLAPYDFDSGRLKGHRCMNEGVANLRLTSCSSQFENTREVGSELRSLDVNWCR